MHWFHKHRPQPDAQTVLEASWARDDAEAWRVAHGGCTYPDCPCAGPCSAHADIAPVSIVNGKVKRGR